jgi:hypothetical protein
MLLDPIYKKIGTGSKKFEIMGIGDVDTPNKLTVWIKCKSCGKVRKYRIYGSCRKSLRCSACNIDEVLISRFESKDNMEFKTFDIITRHEYKKLNEHLVKDNTEEPED